MANDKSIFKYLVCSCGYKKTDPTGKTKADCKNCGSAMALTENWYARITHNGKTTTKAITPRKRDAEDYIAACKIAKRDGALLPGQEKDVDWKDAVDNCQKWWKQDVEKKVIRQSTVDFYAFMLIPLTDRFGNRSLLTITKEMVADYLSARQKIVSATTASRELSTLKRVYSLHTDRLEMEERPRLMAKAMIISRISPPKVDNEIERFCERTEVRDVFKVIADNKKTSEAARHRTRLAIMIGVGLGMRPGNVCALEWKEIDFKTGTIHISKQKMKSKRDFTTGLPDTIKAELQAWRKEQKVLSPYVFPSPKDSRKPIASMKRSISRAIKAAGLNPKDVDRKHKVTTYVLTRHTFASQALMESGDLSAVSEQLHHANIMITKKRYAKVNVSYKKEKIDHYEQAVLLKMVE